MSTPQRDLSKRLADTNYAILYGEENAKVELAIALVKAREKLGLTQHELAKKLGVSQPYIARIESGQSNPTFGKVGSMLAILGLRLELRTEAILKDKPENNIESVYETTSQGEKAEAVPVCRSPKRRYRNEKH